MVAEEHFVEEAHKRIPAIAGFFDCRLSPEPAIESATPPEAIPEMQPITPEPT